MNALLLQSFMLIFAGWVNRNQQDVIEYLQEESQALREQLGGGGSASPTSSVDGSRQRPSTSGEEGSS